MATSSTGQRWTRLRTAVIGGAIAVIAAFAAAGIYQYAADVHWYDGAIEIYFVVFVASPILFLVGAAGALLVRAVVRPVVPLVVPVEGTVAVVAGAPVQPARKTPVVWLVAGGLAGYEAARSTRYLGLPAVPAGPVLGSLLLPPIWILAGAVVAKRAAYSTRSVRAPIGAIVTGGAAFATMDILLIALGIGPFKYDLRGMPLLSAIVAIVAYRQLLGRPDAETDLQGSVPSGSRVWMITGALAGFTASGFIFGAVVHFYSGAIIVGLIPLGMWAGAVAGKRAARSTGQMRAALGGLMAGGASCALMDFVDMVLMVPRSPSVPPVMWGLSAVVGLITYQRMLPDARRLGA